MIYNWGFNSIYGGEEGSYNIVNNYFKPGQATKKNVRNRILNLTQSFYNPQINADTLHAGWFFISGNILEGNTEISNNNWDGGVQIKEITEEIKNKSRLNTPVEHTPIKTESAETSYKNALQFAGARLVTDAVDQRIIREIKTGEEKYGISFEGGKNGIIDSQNEVGAWPELKTQKPEIDTDNDGMPDKWEKNNKLNFQKANSDKYDLDKNYTNIEMYINSLVKHLIQN